MRFWQTGIYILASVLLHAAISGALWFFDRSKPFTVSKLSAPISIDFIEKPKALAEEKAKKQIVEQSTLNDEVDVNAKYLSSHNQRVIKETAAAKQGQFNNQLAAGSRAPRPIALKDLLPKSDPFADFQQKQKSNEQQGQQGSDQLQAQTQDYLKDVDKGLQTLLSTREFVYFTYYNRIRSQLSHHWEPRIKQKVAKIFRHGRKIASTQDRITQVLITLDSAGTLVKVQVLGESGISDLDEAAVEAFRAAAPFPNPPKGIVDADGAIRIRWDFIIEV